MYSAKVYIDRRLDKVLFYKRYEHILSDITNLNSPIYEAVDDFEGYDEPKIIPVSMDDRGYSCDFEFRYGNGLTISIEEVIAEDD